MEVRREAKAGSRASRSIAVPAVSNGTITHHIGHIPSVLGLSAPGSTWRRGGAGDDAGAGAGAGARVVEGAGREGYLRMPAAPAARTPLDAEEPISSLFDRFRVGGCGFVELHADKTSDLKKPGSLGHGIQIGTSHP